MQNSPKAKSYSRYTEENLREIQALWREASAMQTRGLEVVFSKVAPSKFNNIEVESGVFRTGTLGNRRKLAQNDRQFSQKAAFWEEANLAADLGFKVAYARPPKMPTGPILILAALAA